MSPCAAKYAIACTLPWSAAAQGACIPNKAARPSQKTTTFTRFDVTIGTLGIGFVEYSPCLANDGSAFRYTTAAYASDDSVAFTWVGSGKATAQMSNLPYTTAQLNDTATSGSIPQVQGRIVSFSATAKFNGTELNRGGSAVCFTDPGHENLNAQTLAQILSRAEASYEVPNSDRDECSLVLFGISEQEMVYPDLNFAPDAITANIMACFPFADGNIVDSTTTTVGAVPAIMIFKGVAGQTYHVECVQHSEFIGILTEGKTTPNIVDEPSLGRVQGALSRVPQKKREKSHLSAGRVMAECLRETWQELSPVAFDAGRMMLAAALF